MSFSSFTAVLFPALDIKTVARPVLSMSVSLPGVNKLSHGAASGVPLGFLLIRVVYKEIINTPTDDNFSNTVLEDKKV